MAVDGKVGDGYLGDNGKVDCLGPDVKVWDDCLGDNGNGDKVVSDN